MYFEIKVKLLVYMYKNYCKFHLRIRKNTQQALQVSLHLAQEWSVLALHDKTVSIKGIVKLQKLLRALLIKTIIFTYVIFRFYIYLFDIYF